MNYINKGLSVSKLLHFAIAIGLAVLMSACGGGGGSAGTGSGGGVTTYPNGRIVLSLVDASGAASNAISGSTGLTAKAVVTNSTGAPVSGIVVTFSVDSAIAAISPISGTALTDSQGLATISLKSGAGTGAGTLTATTAVVGTTTITGVATFIVSAPPNVTPTAINFVSAAPSDKSIVIKGSGGNGRTEVALLTFSVVDSANVGINNVKVNFVPQSTFPITLSTLSGVTDATGKITVALNSGTQPTTVRIIATVDGTGISTISDTVTVTTGAPTQAAMTMAFSPLWVEGLNWADQRIVVSAYLADQFGGAVADNTPVVFTTDAGAILGIGGAQCQTNRENITAITPRPGYCSVWWRSQNPVPSNGVGTIVATSTNGTSTISASQSFYILGSNAKLYLVNSGDLEGSTTRLPAVSLDLSLCVPKTMTFEIVDFNGNPMPPGSTINTVVPSNSVTVGTVAPSKVPPWNQALGYAQVSHRGTVHTLDVTPPASCKANGTTAVAETFQIIITTPLQVPTPLNVGVSYYK